MAKRILHPEWRDRNETTKYPFADSADLTNSAGDFIGETLFLDVSFYPIGGIERMYLSKVVVTNEKVKIFIGDQNTTELASSEFDLLTPPDIIEFVDADERPAGLIVSEANRLATFQSWTIGTHEFTVDQTEFVARVCMPTPEIGVRGIVLEDGSIFADDIWIIGDDGVVVRRETITVPKVGFTNETETLEVIRVDIIGDPMFRRRLCSNVFVTPSLLKTLTFRHGCQAVVCGPDELGDLKITAGSQDADDTILRIRSVPEGLTFEAIGETVEGIIG